MNSHSNNKQKGKVFFTKRGQNDQSSTRQRKWLEHRRSSQQTQINPFLTSEMSPELNFSSCCGNGGQKDQRKAVYPRKKSKHNRDKKSLGNFSAGPAAAKAAIRNKTPAPMSKMRTFNFTPGAKTTISNKTAPNRFIEGTLASEFIQNHEELSLCAVSPASTRFSNLVKKASTSARNQAAFSIKDNIRKGKMKALCAYQKEHGGGQSQSPSLPRFKSNFLQNQAPQKTLCFGQRSSTGSYINNTRPERRERIGDYCLSSSKQKKKKRRCNLRTCLDLTKTTKRLLSSKPTRETVPSKHHPQLIKLIDGIGSEFDFSETSKKIQFFQPFLLSVFLNFILAERGGWGLHHCTFNVFFNF